jgi:hypothetical protein
VARAQEVAAAAAAAADNRCLIRRRKSGWDRRHTCCWANAADAAVRSSYARRVQMGSRRRMLSPAS